MNLPSLKSPANGSSLIFEVGNPIEKLFADSKSFSLTLSASCAPLACFMLRILINKTTSRMGIVWVSDNECVSMTMLVKEAPLRSDIVNLLDSVNGFDSANVFNFTNVFDSVNAFDFVNVFDCVNVFDYLNDSIGGRHSSIVVPLDSFNVPNVSH